MATNFPGSLDSFTNPTSGSTLDSPSHAAQHANINDAVEALQAKVGVDGSAVTTSLDYKVANMPSFLTGCTNGGGWLYNPADVGNGYYSPAAGATVTLTTGTLVLVIIHADWTHIAGKADYWSVNVTGATTIAPSDSNAIVYTNNATSHRITTGIAFCLTVNAGSNTFQNKMKNVTGSYAQTVHFNRLQIVRLN